MRHIKFTSVGVLVNSEEELVDITNMYTLLGIKLSEGYEKNCENAKQLNFRGYFIQTDLSDIAKPGDVDLVDISIIHFPISYVMDKVDFAIAFNLLKSDQLDELAVYLDEHCTEYSQQVNSK